MPNPITDPGPGLRLAKWGGIKGARFLLPEVDDVIVPVVVLDTIGPTDPRVSLSRNYTRGRLVLPRVGHRALSVLHLPIGRQDVLVHIAGLSISGASGSGFFGTFTRNAENLSPALGDLFLDKPMPLARPLGNGLCNALAIYAQATLAELAAIEVTNAEFMTQLGFPQFTDRNWFMPLEATLGAGDGLMFYTLGDNERLDIQWWWREYDRT